MSYRFAFQFQWGLLTTVGSRLIRTWMACVLLISTCLTHLFSWAALEFVQCLEVHVHSMPRGRCNYFSSDELCFQGKLGGFFCFKIWKTLTATGVEIMIRQMIANQRKWIWLNRRDTHTKKQRSLKLIQFPENALFSMNIMSCHYWVISPSAMYIPAFIETQIPSGIYEIIHKTERSFSPPQWFLSHGLSIFRARFFTVALTTWLVLVSESFDCVIL